MSHGVKGWCPGALRPMQTGDGLLVRLRPRGGALSGALMSAIADCAERFGNGLIELTSRANVQLRGIRTDSLMHLQQIFHDLQVLDAEADAEAVRNVIVSPLAGLDPLAKQDIRPVVTALEDRIARDQRLWDLPGKFGFVVEDGGSFDLSDVVADVRFVATRQGFIVWLAGCAEPHGFCAPTALADVATDIALAFLAARGDGPDASRRMRDVAHRLPPGSCVSNQLLRADNFNQSDAHARTRRFADPTACLGLHSMGAAAFVGVTRPFGRWTAREWRELVANAPPNADFRLTPWRILLVAGLSDFEAKTLGGRLAAAGHIMDPIDARLSVAACPGSPACASATTATQADALALAELARQIGPKGVTLHVSGCAKGCARAEKSTANLVGREGRYDLVLDGKAGDSAIVHNLDLSAAANALRALAAGSLHPENLP